jgi:uncharacterized protein YecE (DUF72 family)
MQREPGFHVGTSGWYYDHWRGLFYPDDLPKSDWFRYYARHFATVELNNSFYRQPKPSTWDGWREGAPPGFRFAVKANRYISHLLRFRNCDQPLQRFLNGATRLGPHLGPILFQTPPDFELNDETLHRLDAFIRLLPGDLRHVFEFRHNSWFSDQGIDLLKRHGIGFCIHDMPGLTCPVLLTTDFAYIRLHGAGMAYSGDYDDDALRLWAGRIRDLRRGGATEVWIYFNNDIEGYAVANARTLAALLASG